MIKRNARYTYHSAFTLIELLVVIVIIGILVSLSVFGMQGAKKSSRDGRRQADLEQIRSGLEMYKADCNSYPTSITFGGSLTGSCPSSATYISLIPNDPSYSARNYHYHGCTDGSRYILCAALENTSPGVASVSCVTPGTSVNCGGGSDCGSGVPCNYKVNSP